MSIPSNQITSLEERLINQIVGETVLHGKTAAKLAVAEWEIKSLKAQLDEVIVERDLSRRASSRYREDNIKLQKVVDEANVRITSLLEKRK